MDRQFEMCDVCKLDKAQKCNYQCIKKREDCLLMFFTCPNFIYDDGTPITNAERISTLLKTECDSAADEIWYETILNDGCLNSHDFRLWLEEESK